MLCQPYVPYTDMEIQLDNEYSQLKKLSVARVKII